MAQGYEVPRIRRVQGRVIEIDHLELPAGPKTRLSADAVATATSLTVLDNSGFGNPQFVLIRPYGTQNAEIRDVTGTTGGTTITLASGVTYAHAAGEEVQEVYFDQWRIYGNATNTTAGATLVATIDVDASEKFTTYVNTGTEYAFYFVRPYDSIDAVDGDNYSDGVASASGYARNSVQHVVRDAMETTGSHFGGRLTFERCIDFLNEGMDDIRGELEKWSGLQEFDYALGQTARGVYAYTLPTDMYDVNSTRSLLDVRVGGDASLQYMDKKRWEEAFFDTRHTQVRTQALTGDTTLEIDNSYDFGDSGTIHVSVNNTLQSITYTGVTRSATAGVLTGIPATGTGSITATIPVGTDVWQNEEEGKPQWYTVYDGSLYLFPLPDANHVNKNIWMDYYTDIVEVDSGADTFTKQFLNALRYYLRWKIRGIKNELGAMDMRDGDFLQYQQEKEKIIFKELNRRKGTKMKHPVYNLSGGTKTISISRAIE